MRRFSISMLLAVAFAVATTLVVGCREGASGIQVIVFDVGGVLSKDMIDTKLIDLATSHRLDVDSLLAVKNRYRDPADLGEISDTEFWVRILGHFDVPATPQDTEIDTYIELVEGTLDIAKSLSRRYRTAILSNDSREMAALRRKKFGFDAVFNPIIISANVGVKKPDPMIYKVLLETLGIAAHECLFIDNSLDNVEAARSVGMRAILFDSALQLREALSELGIEV